MKRLWRAARRRGRKRGRSAALDGAKVKIWTWCNWWVVAFAASLEENQVLRTSALGWIIPKLCFSDGDGRDLGAKADLGLAFPTRFPCRLLGSVFQLKIVHVALGWECWGLRIFLLAGTKSQSLVSAV